MKWKLKKYKLLASAIAEIKVALRRGLLKAGVPKLRSLKAINKLLSCQSRSKSSEFEGPSVLEETRFQR